MSSTPRARVASVALAVVTVIVMLAGCSQTGSSSTRLVPKHEALFAPSDHYPDVPIEANLQYGTANHAPLVLDVCLPRLPAGTTPAPRPAIISIHGGSWEHGDKAVLAWRDICKWLAAAGYVTASVDYRLAPAHPYPDAIDDIRTAVRWLRAPAQVKRFHIDPSLIGAFGGSAGGNLAAMLGTAGSGPLDSGDRVAAVAELSGPTNLTATGPELGDLADYQLQYLRCTTLTSCPNAIAASPLFHVSPDDPPFFVAHSLRERIPLTQATRFVAKLRAAGVNTTFVTMDGQLHSLAMMTTGLETRILAFYRANLVHTTIVTK